MKPLPVLVKAAWASGASAAAAAALQAASDVHPSPAAIVDSALGGAMVVLFGLFIKHGNQLAGLRVYAERNKGDIDKLDAASSTVDKRIEASRHMVRTEAQALTSNVEDRLMVRMEELQRANARLEERLNHFLEAASERETPQRRR